MSFKTNIQQKLLILYLCGSVRDSLALCSLSSNGGMIKSGRIVLKILNTFLRSSSNGLNNMWNVTGIRDLMKCSTSSSVSLLSTGVLVSHFWLCLSACMRYTKLVHKCCTKECKPSEATLWLAGWKYDSKGKNQLVKWWITIYNKYIIISFNN